jgi:hypothetical protein
MIEMKEGNIDLSFSSLVMEKFISFIAIIMRIYVKLTKFLRRIPYRLEARLNFLRVTHYYRKYEVKNNKQIYSFKSP